MTKERLKKAIGGNIRKARLSRGMSIDELAELLQLTSGFVGLIERGSRGATVYTLYKLADIMETSIDSFFYSGPGPNTKFEEDKPGKKNKGNPKKDKIASLIVDFSDSEFDFIIGVIKNLRSLNHAAVQKGTDDEED
ncbi:MAG: helix-turn-helix domain-containing protein [Firmicutes bacterium]|nr:helix-turn-helix domain-containing protein [Bacillota bacterium]